MGYFVCEGLRQQLFLPIKYIFNYVLIGRGVVATHPVEPGDFVLEYRGELLEAEECRARHYTELETPFLFEFDWQGRSWW